MYVVRSSCISGLSSFVRYVFRKFVLSLFLSSVGISVFRYFVIYFYGYVFSCLVIYYVRSFFRYACMYRCRSVFVIS